MYENVRLYSNWTDSPVTELIQQMKVFEKRDGEFYAAMDIA